MNPLPLPAVHVSQSRATTIGTTPVRRALPQRTRRTVSSWCFADHIGPVTSVSDPIAAGIGPHPHIGLQTVTWLLDGELRHVDSLGSDQLIRPGQLNLMTAGNGIAHAEEWRGGSGAEHGIQLWVALPEHTRHGNSAFTHYDELPRVALDNGTATVLIGSIGSASSPARRDTDHFGAELNLRAGTSIVEVQPEHEVALIVLSGSVAISDQITVPGELAYLGAGIDELPLRVPPGAPSIAMLIGGIPFESPIAMWWNFVGRNHNELTQAGHDWNNHGERFGAVASSLPIIAAPRPPF